MKIPAIFVGSGEDLGCHGEKAIPLRGRPDDKKLAHV
jgi:hypothetical protein